MRGFTLVEVVVAAAITAVIAGAAIATASTAAARHRISSESQQVLQTVSRQRAAHVAEARTELLVICADCVDDSGAPQARLNPNALDIYLANGASPDRGRLVESKSFGISVEHAGCERVVLDGLGRSVVPAPTGLTARDAGLRLAADSDDPQDINFASAGNITSSFAPPIPVAPAHASNLSSRLTPVPMSRGTFQGDPQVPLALPLH
jgi:prepilin-type N-terminal cleavage/methylation domain-containing protein